MARKDAVESRKAKGGRQISASLNAEQAAMLDRLKEKFPALSQKALLMKALSDMECRTNALSIEDITPELVAQWALSKN